MQQFDNVIFWCYIFLLLLGGLIGFFKGSKVSLTTSAVAAALLILTRIGILEPSFARKLANIIMLVLLVVFAIRLGKTKKFVPSGLMLVLTTVVLALLNFHRNW